MDILLDANVHSQKLVSIVKQQLTMAPERLIDAVPAPENPKEIKLLALGMSRTGELPNWRLH